MGKEFFKSKPDVQGGMVVMPHTHIIGIGRNALGRIKFIESTHNLVVNSGLDDLLNKRFKASSYTSADYVGLKGTGSVAAADTMSSHSGWSEVTGYSESVRQTLTLGTVSGQSVDNSASKATFSINSSVTVAGAFIVTNSTKGGSTGILYGAADFSSPRSLTNGDTLNVQATLSMSAS